MFYKWPEVFEDPTVVTNGMSREEAVADGLTGWALCMAGADRPDNFGKGMARIGTILGITATPENLTIEADKILQPVVGK